MEDLLIPEFLCGTPVDVRRNCRMFARKLVKKNSWDKAMDDEELVLLNDTPGMLVVRDSHLPLDYDNVVTYPLFDAISHECCKIDTNWPAIYVPLIDEGLYTFWLALCALNSRPLIHKWNKVVDTQSFNLRVFRRILKWWPAIAEQEDRFHRTLLFESNWKSWGRGIFAYAAEAGMSDHEIREVSEMDCESAGTAIAKWLDQG